MQITVLLLGLLLTLQGAIGLGAQSAAIDPAFKTATIERLSALINDHYVFPDVAAKTGDYLQKQLGSGAFDQTNDLPSFAAALTKDVQSVNKDKHMRIRPASQGSAPEGSLDQMAEEKLNDIARQRSNMAGFREVKRLDGNIGYIDLRSFAPVGAGGPVADRYMGLLAGSDAIIIDMRRNGGGSPDMVQYLCSYFFDQRVHLNSLYWRETNETKEFWTLDQVGGQKMPDVPLFILTSSYTFSGAEEFCYNMQTRQRAILIGETTGGGANPGGMFPINEKLAVFIPTGRAINPVTKTNWEGTGVEPEVKTTAEAAFDKAVELAGKAAEEYRMQLKTRHKKLIAALLEQLEKNPAERSEEGIFQALQICCSTGLMNEDDINSMGYAYLQRFQKPATAEIIFKCNARLFPQSANVYDSYGEALLINGKKAEAVKSYQKAVELAEAHHNPNLELFKKNLKSASKETVKRP